MNAILERRPFPLLRLLPLVLVATLPLHAAQSGAHTPAYPFEHVNAPKRLTDEKVLVIKVSHLLPPSPKPPFSHTQIFPNTAEGIELEAGYRTLLENNSYDQASASFHPSPSGELFFDVQMPSPPTGTTANLLDIWSAFQNQHPGQPAFAYFDRIVLFLEAPSLTIYANDKFIVFSNPSLPGPSGSLTVDQLHSVSAAILHEAGHGYGMLHANLWKLPPGATDGTVETYADLFDYMGDMRPKGRRFNTACHPSGVVFAPPTEVHGNPTRKLQHGWLVDQGPSPDVVTVTSSGSERYDLAPIASGSGLRAVRIERKPSSMSTSAWPWPLTYNEFESLVVTWRAHEPMQANGVTVTVESREFIQLGSQLLEQFTGASSTCPGVAPIPGQIVSIAPGDLWEDPGSDVRIECLQTPGAILVHAPQPDAYANVPVLDIVSSTQNGDIVGSGDVIQIGINAANSEGNPTQEPWHDITHVDVWLSLPGKRVLRFGTGPDAPYARREFTDETFLWNIAADELFSPSFSPGAIRGLVAITAAAYTDKGTSILGKRAFFLDQTQ